MAGPGALTRALLDGMVGLVAGLGKAASGGFVGLILGVFPGCCTHSWLFFSV